MINNRTDKWTPCELRVLMGYHKSGVSASELVDTKLGNKNTKG